MKIFVFGAGASLAAQDEALYNGDASKKAPLVDELFNDPYRSALINGLSLDLEECRAELQKNHSVEKWLSQRWEAISSIITDRKKRAERSWFGNVNLYIWNVLNTISKTYPDAQGYTPLLRVCYALLKYLGRTKRLKSRQEIRKH